LTTDFEPAGEQDDPALTPAKDGCGDKKIAQNNATIVTTLSKRARTETIPNVEICAPKSCLTVSLEVPILGTLSST
jgi:hypothetical protein